MTFCVDTNVLVYLYDRRFPRKRDAARALVDGGLRSGNMRLPYQALVEFVPALSRPQRDGSGPILPREEALREAEEWLDVAPVLYPDEELFRIATRGAPSFQISWFDALVWAYADRFAIPMLYSEDFQDGRRYGRTTVTNPFGASGPVRILE